MTARLKPGGHKAKGSSAGFASDYRWILNPNTRYRANYDVTLKCLKNGNAQGSILYVEHRPNGDRKVKSTSLNSKGGFAIVAITGGSGAQITGRGNFGDNDRFTRNYPLTSPAIGNGTP